VGARRVAALLVSGALATGAFGCSDDDSGDDGEALASGAVAGEGSGYLDRGRLETRLANGFRAGLYRLAVMNQPEDSAVDLGQQLPTGKVSEVTCEQDTERPSSGPWPWRCTVDWLGVEGRSHVTHYDVELTRNACFAASATPRYDAEFDASIGAASEHPLNTLGRELGRC
jgi:hypothetical protein